MTTYKIQEEKLILGNFDIFGFFEILRDTNKFGKLKLECYFELLQKYKYPISKIDFDEEDIVVYKDFAKTEPYIVIAFEKPVKEVLEKAKKLSAQFAVLFSKNNKKIINIKEGGKEEQDIPNYYNPKF